LRENGGARNKNEQKLPLLSDRKLKSSRRFAERLFRYLKALMPKSRCCVVTTAAAKTWRNSGIQGYACLMGYGFTGMKVSRQS
jgi:hypothetical protein